MNPSQDSPNASEDRRIDLLVDGELAEPQRSELLRQLESQPGGWRRCALAFLEAQVWRQALGPMADRDRPAPPVLASPPIPAVPVVPPIRPRRMLPLGWLGTASAMAASFLFAAALGLVVVKQRGPLVGPSPTDFVAVPQVYSPSVLPPPGEIARPVAPPSAGLASAPTQGPWQTVRVSLPGGPQGTGETIELPAVERDRVDEAWLKSLPSPLTPEMLGALRDRGFEVRQHRELLPGSMQDGRRLVVPVDQVEVHYVGGQKYQ